MICDDCKKVKATHNYCGGAKRCDACSEAFRLKNIEDAEARKYERNGTKYVIENEDTGVQYADCGRWRSYDLHAVGNSLQELIESAAISETDQDGGEIDTYCLEDAETEVQKAAYHLIEMEIQKIGRKSYRPWLSEVKKEIS